MQTRVNIVQLLDGAQTLFISDSSLSACCCTDLVHKRQLPLYLLLH